MNLERFHTIIATAYTEYLNQKVTETLENVVASLQQQISNPQDTNHQQNLSQHRKKLRNILGEVASTRYPESWKRTLQEFSLDLFIGEVLLERVESAFSGNEITPQIALETLQNIKTQLDNKNNAIDRILHGFSDIGVDSIDLNPGECEVSITIPRDFISSDPMRLGREIISFEENLEPFAEAATGERLKFQVRSISSSEFVIDLAIFDAIQEAAKTVKLIAEAIGEIIIVYAEVEGLRSMKNKFMETSGKKESKEEIKNKLEEYTASIVESKIKKYLEKCEKEGRINVKKGDSDRVKRQIHKSMKAFAYKIDNGYDIETRMEPPTAPEGEEDGEQNADAFESLNELREAFDEISTQHQRQKRFQRVGEPILNLPSPSNDDNQAGGASADD